MGVRRATGRTLGFTLEFMHVPALDRERETPANRKSRVLGQKTSPEKMRKVELRGWQQYYGRFYAPAKEKSARFLARRIPPRRSAATLELPEVAGVSRS